MLPSTILQHAPEKKLIGRQATLSFQHNTTGELWRSFMPHRKAIPNPVGTALYSVEVYNDPAFFEPFDPSRPFQKWAAVEVHDFNQLPQGMEPLTIPAGHYAVFHYKGRASEAAAMYRYIFGVWLPGSGYRLDDRPHFARMGDKYRNDSPDSEEELWIPVRPA